MLKFLTRIQRNKHFQYGVPFFLFIFGGKFVLEEFRSVRYDPELNPKGNRKFVTQEQLDEEIKYQAERERAHIKEKTLEEYLAETEKQANWDNTDHWENKRGPRPWEGNYQQREVKTPKKSAPKVEDLD